MFGILENGFAWVPNRRRLTEVLLPQHDFSKREPQQFGMVSFTELLPGDANMHRAHFGSFGIVVTKGWAENHGAQRVFYVEKIGSVTQSLRVMFDLAYRDLVVRIRYPDDAAQAMAFENKNMASIIGATLWAQLLTLWEFLEPEESSPQREWRIVNPNPDYSIEGPTSSIIAAVSPPVGWANVMRLVKLTPADVVAFVCPRSSITRIRAKLPESYRHVSVITHDDLDRRASYSSH